MFLVVLAGVALCRTPRLLADSNERSICIGAASGNPGARASVPVTLDNGDGVAAYQKLHVSNQRELTLVILCAHLTT